MKYAMLPTPWEETLQALDSAGHERTPLEEAEALIFNGGPDDFPQPLPPSVGLVQVPFAGVDHLLDVMRNTSARWSNAAGLYDATVAESTIALLLAQLHAHKRVGTSWDNRDEVEAHTSFLFEDKTVAVVGAGGIGKRLIRMLEGLRETIRAVNRSGNPGDGAEDTYATADIERVSPAAEYFVALAPLTEQTRQIFGAAAFRAMPNHAVVINVGRGPLVDTDALVDALRAGQIAGAGLDVTDPEPLPDGHPLWEMPNVVITPHLANPPYSVRCRIGAHAAKVMERFAAGEAIPTEVDIEAGY